MAILRPARIDTFGQIGRNNHVRAGPGVKIVHDFSAMFSVPIPMKDGVIVNIFDCRAQLIPEGEGQIDPVVPLELDGNDSLRTPFTKGALKRNGAILYCVQSGERACFSRMLKK
jgi:hypothetical protein